MFFLSFLSCTRITRHLVQVDKQQNNCKLGNNINSILLYSGNTYIPKNKKINK